MKNHRLIYLSFLLFGQIAFGQKLDSTIYLTLLKADKEAFTNYAKSVGLTVELDSLSNTLFAKTKGILFSKPLADKGNDYYALNMMVSTLNKDNSESIVKNAQPVEGKKNTWIDDNYLYITWDLENPVSKEMWFRVLVYKRKQR
jgi:hypothetical protein